MLSTLCPSHSGDRAVSSALTVIGKVYRLHVALIGLTHPPQNFLNNHGYRRLKGNDRSFSKL